MGSLTKRNLILTVLVGIVFSAGCRAAKKPIPAPAVDARVGEAARSGDSGARWRMFLGYADCV